MLFKNQEALMPEYLPEILPHRDYEIDNLSFLLKPLTQGSRAPTIVVLGPPGTGKTATVNFVLDKLQEESDRVKAIYLNCWEFNSRTAVLSKIVNFLGSPMPRRGLAADEIYERLKEMANKTPYSSLIVLDEADQLKEANKIFYDLLRIKTKKPLCLLLISNNLSFLMHLDPRVKSSMQEQRIFFEAYNPIQLKDILKERVSLAFEDNKVEDDVINVSAAYAAKNKGDARLAIEAILKAGRLAEMQGAEKLKVEHLRKVLDEAENYKLKEKSVFLTDDEKKALSFLKTEMTSGELYSKYKKALKSKAVSDRQFRNILTSLQKHNFIEFIAVNKGSKGRTRIVKPKYSLEALEKIIK